MLHQVAPTILLGVKIIMEKTALLVLCEAVLYMFVFQFVFLAVLSRFGKLNKSFRLHQSSSPNWLKVTVTSVPFCSSSGWVCLPSGIWLFRSIYKLFWIMIVTVTAFNRFAKAYHLRGLLLYGMGEHRYFIPNNWCSVNDLSFYLVEKWFSQLTFVIFGTNPLMMWWEIGKNNLL